LTNENPIETTQPSPRFRHHPPRIGRRMSGAMALFLRSVRHTALRIFCAVTFSAPVTACFPPESQRKIEIGNSNSGWIYWPTRVIKYAWIPYALRFSAIEKPGEKSAWYENRNPVSLERTGFLLSRGAMTASGDKPRIFPAPSCRQGGWHSDETTMFSMKLTGLSTRCM